MSSEKSDSSFFPKSNAFKSILNKPKEEKKSFGKEEFLARRKFFLQKLESEGGIPKPKSLINNSSTKKKTSNEKIKTTYNKPISSSTSNVTNNIKSTKSNEVEKKEKIVLPDHEWSVSSAKSESLKKIIDLAGKKETNTVGKNIFDARQKFFADSQLSSVDQLMPRPATPPGYCYFERCPSPSIEPRRNSYSLYTSSSPSLSSSTILSSSPKPVIAPSPKPATYSLPWEHGNDRKKDVVQPKPKSPVNVIESLEKLPLVSEETIKLDPISFTKETLPMDEPSTIKIEKVEIIKPMVGKIIEFLPEPIQFTTETLSFDEPLTVKTINVEEIKPYLPKRVTIQEKLPEPIKFTKEQLPMDEPINLNTTKIEIPKMNIPKLIHILPEPVSFEKEVLPQDKLNDVIIEKVVSSNAETPKIINIMPEPVKVSNVLLPNDEPLKIENINVSAEEKKIPEKIYISDKYDEVNTELKSDIAKTMDISSLTLESNIEEKKENRKSSDSLLNNYYTNETQPLIDINSESSENKSDNIDENQPLLEHQQSLHEKQPLIDFNDEIIDDIQKPLIDFDNELIIDNKPLIDFNTESINNNITGNTLISFDDEHDIEVKNKKSSIGSISELLNNGTLSIDEPLPRKSIPTYQNEDNTVNDLIDFSDSDNLSDKVKNWYNIIDNALTNEENKNE
jgi:hypothetical protein